MRSLVLIFLILSVVHCSCPDGFELVRDGECRGFYATISLVLNQATDTAISKCKEIQAHAVTIHTDEQQSYWISQHMRRGNRIPIGIVCTTSSNNWEWTDGSSVDYKPTSAGYSKELDGDCKPDCGWYIVNDSGFWNIFCAQSTVEPFDIFCTKQIHPLIDGITNDGCDLFEEDSDDGACYMVGTTAENWQDAQMACLKLGANLASIHNLQENSFVRRLAVSKGAVTGLYLGATISGKGKSYGWIDGSDWDYDNFAPDFPIPGFGDCIGMDTSTPTGQWMNIECSAKLPVACIREHRVIREPTTCSSGPFVEEAIITSPGFPYNASTPCDFYLKVDEEKRVEVEIILLEANSCCDSLVLYDGHMGGVVLANLTGEIHNKTYTTTSVNTMKVSWLPKGGVNVLGMALTFRGV